MVSPYFDEIKTKGRPKKILNATGIDTIKQLSRIQCTDEEIASVLGVSVDTLTRAANKDIFEEAKASGKEAGKASLRRMQFKTAEAGNATMLIWLGKQYLGQTDKQDVKVDTEQDFVFNIMPASEKGKSDAE